jgi:hypothetical protein
MTQSDGPVASAAPRSALADFAFEALVALLGNRRASAEKLIEASLQFVVLAAACGERQRRGEQGNEVSHMGPHREARLSNASNVDAAISNRQPGGLHAALSKRGEHTCFIAGKRAHFL